MFDLKSKLSRIWYATGAAATVNLVSPQAALAVVPTPPTPSTSPNDNDAIGWFKGVFEDSSEVGILVIGVVLFLIGAVGMIWSVTQILTNKGTLGDVAKIGLASAAGIAFGTYLLGRASNIITP